MTWILRWKERGRQKGVVFLGNLLSKPGSQQILDRAKNCGEEEGGPIILAETSHLLGIGEKVILAD